MAAIIFEKSAQITDRLVSMIREAGNGIDIYHTDSYSDVVSLLYQKKIDVTLLDLSYGEEVSMELLDLIKQINPQILVIMMYGSSKEKNFRACQSNGPRFLFDKYHDFEKIPTIMSFVS